MKKVGQVKEYIENNKKNILIFSVFMLISLIFYGIFVKMDFAADSYCYFMNKEYETINAVSQGRVLKALLFIFVFKLPFSESIGYLISYAIAIFSITFAAFKLYKTFEDDIKSKIVNFLITVLIIMNPFSIELFMFFEKGTMSLAILFTILAFCHFKKYLKDGTKNKLAISLIYLILGNFSYQGVTALFIGLASVYCIKYSKNLKKFIINNLLMGSIFVISAGINLIFTKIFAYSRVSSSFNLIEAISNLPAAGLTKMFKTFNIIPAYFFVICLILILLTIFITICFNKETISKKLVKLISVIYIILAVVFSAIAPQLTQSIDSMWFTPRATYIYASILGLLELALVIIVLGNNERMIEKCKYLLIIFNILFLLVQFYRFINIEIDRYRLNYLDRENSLKIGQLIEEYEKENNVQITKICTYRDKNPRSSYNGIDISTELNLSALAIDWSDYAAINYYNKLDLKKVKGNEELEEYFKNKDWNDFSKEQLIFKDDTLHLCIY